MNNIRYDTDNKYDIIFGGESLTDNSRLHISTGQLAALIVIYRISTLMTYIPLVRQGCSTAEQLCALAVSSLIQTAMLIPAVICSEKGILPDGFRNKALNIAADVIYSLYFMLVTVETLVRSVHFMDSRFGNSMPVIVTAAMFTAVCFYCAYCGIEGIARGTMFTAVFFAIICMVMAYGNKDVMTLENIGTHFETGNFFRAVYGDISRSPELTLLCCMAGYTSGKYRRAVFGANIGKFFITAAVTAAVFIVLGDYVYMCDYPFLKLGSAAGVNFLQRIDALYMVVWVLAAAAGMSAMIFAASEKVREVINLGKCTAYILTVLLIFAAAAAVYRGRIDGGLIAAVSSLPVQAVTAVLIPLAALISSRLCGKGEAS